MTFISSAYPQADIEPSPKGNIRKRLFDISDPVDRSIYSGWRRGLELTASQESRAQELHRAHLERVGLTLGVVAAETEAKEPVPDQYAQFDNESQVSAQIGRLADAFLR